MKEKPPKNPKIIPEKEGSKIVKKALKQGFKKDASSDTGALAARENIYGFSSELTEFSGNTIELLGKLFPKINMPLKFDTEIEKLSSTYITKAEVLRLVREELDAINSEINELKKSVKEYEKPHQKAILLDKADETAYQFALQGVKLEKKKLELKDVVQKGEVGLENIAKKIKKILDQVSLQ